VLLAWVAAGLLGCAAPGGSPADSPSGPTPTAGRSRTIAPADQPAAVLIGPAAVSPGVLGSWTLDGEGSDSPWLPPAALTEVGVDAAGLTVRFAGDVEIGAWSARAAPVSDPAGEAAFSVGGRDGDHPALNSVTLDPLPPGRWVLAVRLDRADGRGDATFYWLVAS
jgi:hypothetical protein